MDQSILHCKDCGIDCLFIGSDRLDALRLACERGWRLIFDEDLADCAPLYRCGACERRRLRRWEARGSHVDSQRRTLTDDPFR